MIPHRNTQPQRVTIYGYTFDSILESRRYVHLMALQATGNIAELEVQFPFLIRGCGVRGRYTSDFFYYDTRRNIYIVEDVKSPYTASLDEWKDKKKILISFFNGWTWRNRKVEFREMVINN